MSARHDGRFEDVAEADLDRDAPLEPEEHEAQIRGLRRRLTGGPRRVLDLGCGGGRTLLPLAAAGHHVVGIDGDPEARRVCGERLAAADLTAELLAGDLRSADGWPAGPFDVVLCLGHTFMLLHEVDDAVACLVAARSRLAPDGVLILDDLPGMLWPTVAAGDWPAGLAEDGSAQMTWAARDAVFAVRDRASIDAERFEPGPQDRRCRLWTDGSLRLAARLAGFSDPEPAPRQCLLIMRPAVTPADGSASPSS
jgi:SAM-dependent methyltransferase